MKEKQSKLGRQGGDVNAAEHQTMTTEISKTDKLSNYQKSFVSDFNTTFSYFDISIPYNQSNRRVEEHLESIGLHPLTYYDQDYNIEQDLVTFIPKDQRPITLSECRSAFKYLKEKGFEVEYYDLYIDQDNSMNRRVGKIWFKTR